MNKPRTYIFIVLLIVALMAYQVINVIMPTSTSEILPEYQLKKVISVSHFLMVPTETDMVSCWQMQLAIVLYIRTILTIFDIL